MNRGDIYWATFDAPIGRGPVIILTRTPALTYLTSVTVARITSRVRGTPAEIRLDQIEGLSRASVANLFNIDTIEQSRLDPERAGNIGRRRVRELDEALMYALGVGR